MHIAFETFVERSNRARTTDELVKEFLATVKQHGLDRMVFCLQTNHDHIDMKPGFGTIQNYPEDWMKHYFEKRYDRVDPVTSYCLNKMDTFTWAEIPERMKMTRQQFQCLNMGIEAGLYNGVCTPLWGPNRFAGIGLASKEKVDSFDGRLDLITAYCNHFYIAFQRINQKKDRPERNIYLTPREAEILTWVAVGKSDSDIATILNISEETVDTHMRRMFGKLNAPNRVVAASKGISYGLIRPCS
jgi:DNA-binding CsgD family transcriptional regulator